MCALCGIYEKRNIITKFYYEDEKVIVVDCLSHPGAPMIVLKRHTGEPTPEEMEYIKEIVEGAFPAREFRGPASMPYHYHAHF